MVGANTFRNPGHTAKLATTLDHVSGGRAVLGIGGAWFEREHDAFGIDFGATPGERLDRLDESVMLMRRLLDGERFSHEGPALHVPRRAVRAAADPGPPADPRRRVGADEDAPDGGRARRRLEHARARSTRSATRLDIARRARADVGRDLGDASRRPSASRSSSRRPRPPRGTVRRRCWRPTASPDDGQRPGPPRAARARWPTRSGRIASLGFATVIVRMPAPYDRETIERMAEVRELLDA